MFGVPNQLIALGLAVLVLVGASIAVWRYGLGIVTAPVKYGASGAKGWVVRLLLGPNGNLITRLMAIFAITFGAAAGVGIWFIATSNVDTTTSSAPVIQFVLGILTSSWGYVFSVAFFARGSLFGLRKLLINQTASKTGYTKKTVSRLSEEVQTLDGTVTVYVFGDDDFENIVSRLLDGFSGQGETLTDNWVDPDADESAADTADADADADADTDSEESDTDPRDDIVDADDGVTDLPATPEASDIASREDGDVWTDDDLRLSERMKMGKMKLLATPNTDRLIWRLLLPIALIFGAELIVVKFWVSIWMYGVLGAAAIAGGLLFYLVTQWRHRNRLDTLRQEGGTAGWDEVAVPVKRVETPDLTVYIGFIGGRSYLDTDPERLAETLAHRALEASHQSSSMAVSPAVQERWAHLAKRYYPIFSAWNGYIERVDIQDKLLSNVKRTTEKALPAEYLAEQVIEDGREFKWFGLRHVGFGHDPRLVANEYANLVRSGSLTTRDVEMESPDGETFTHTVVRPREESQTMKLTELRTRFSERFPPHRVNSRYSLPDVEPEGANERVTLPPSAVPDGHLPDGFAADSDGDAAPSAD